MNVNVIRKALHKQPFESFLFRLADRRQFAVPHPDFVAVSNRRVLVINLQDEQCHLARAIVDRFH
jgi:hypothetical protein